MRVSTKYGKGTLIGITTNSTDTQFGYVVLLDNLLSSDINEDEKEFNVTKGCTDRVYNCRAVQVLSDDGKMVEFSNKIEIIGNNN